MGDLRVSALGHLFDSAARLKSAAQAWRGGDASAPVTREIIANGFTLVMALTSMEPTQSLPIDVHRRLLLDLSDPELDLTVPVLPPEDGDAGASTAEVERLAQSLQWVVDVVRELFALRAGVHSPTTDLFGVPQFQSVLESYAGILGKLEALRLAVGPDTDDGYGLSLASTLLQSEVLVVQSVARMTIFGDLDRDLLTRAVGLLRDRIEELAGFPPSVGLTMIRQTFQMRKWAAENHALMLRRMSVYPPPLGDADEWVEIHAEGQRLAEEMHGAVEQQADALVADITEFATALLGSEAAGQDAVAAQVPGGDLRNELRAQRVFSEGRLLTAEVRALEARLLAAVVAGDETAVGELSDEISRRYVPLMASASALDHLMEQSQHAAVPPGTEHKDPVRLFSSAVAQMEDRSARAREAARGALRGGSSLDDAIAALAEAARRAPVNLFVKEVFMGSKYEFNAPVTGAVGDHAVYFQGSLAGVDRARLAAELAALRAELPRDEISEDDEAALQSAETAARSGDEKALVSALKSFGAKLWDLAAQVGTGVALAAAKAQLGL